jgi:6-phosphogluconolactonase
MERGLSARAGPVPPELIVVPDLAGAAVERFLALRPRTVALTGGSTPRAFYERLAGVEYAWADTHLFFGDERCVPPDHRDSNFRMADEALLSRVPARVHRMPGETCDAAACERELASVFGEGLPAFDLVLLGLGEDGHVASLFPGAASLGVTDRHVIRVEHSDHARLTLTLPVINAARHVLFLVEGERKRDALRRLVAGDDIPAARVTAPATILADESAYPVP